MKKLPIGRSDFKKIITQNYCYVDKTLFIKDIMDKGIENIKKLAVVFSGKDVYVKEK